MLYTFASKRLSLIVHDTKSKEGGNFIRKDYLFKLGYLIGSRRSRKQIFIEWGSWLPVVVVVEIYSYYCSYFM